MLSSSCSSARRQRVLRTCLVAAALLCLGGTAAEAMDEVHGWNDGEKALIRSLSLSALGPPAPNPSNSYAGRPEAQSLGRRFFFDPRFSGNRMVSCATCHRADYSFTDDLPLAHGMGTTSRRTMPLIGMAYQSWFFWDGRKDSMWSQSLGPIESPVEHGFSRTESYVLIRDSYRKDYEEVFGPFPEIGPGGGEGAARPAHDDATALKSWVGMTPEDREAVNRVYANMGKAIGAFVGTIMPAPSRFDEYADAVLAGDRSGMMRIFTPTEAAGLRLFIGKAGCVNCHNGPFLTNGDFHHVGVPDAGTPDRGREQGIIDVLADEFNCLGRYSDAPPKDCLELRFLETDTTKYRGAFKTPTLRNVAMRPPYMHAGQFATLGAVLNAYRTHARELAEQREPGEHPRGAEIAHGDLSDEDLDELEAFLHTLNAELREIGRRP